MQFLRSPRFLIAWLLFSAVISLTGCGGLASKNNTVPSSTLAASRPSISFGNVQKGKSAGLTETLTNTGAATLTISAASTSGAGFSISGLSLPTTLSGGESITFTVTFSPTSSGSASGTLSAVSTAVNPTLKISLSGNGMAQGQLTVSPATLSFGQVVVGAKSSLNGTLEATGSSITIASAVIGSSEYALSGITLPATLTAGQAASFTVTFKPATSGSASASLSFSSDAANSPAVQDLTGTGGTAPAHWVDLSWTAPGSGVVGYNVYRGSVNGGPYSKINSALDASTAFSDNNVTSGKTYFYVTTAVDGSGSESRYSNQVQAVIPTP